ncbi:MAG: starch-binding protein [Flavobacterium sp.]|nr:starch-binding protein [Flavobacterium sp.]
MMKQKLFLLICLFFGLTQLDAQTLEQSMYVDFGPTGGTNGAITPSPDANQHYWNNPTSGTLGSVTALVNANNAATGYNMTVTDNFVVNTGINYGPTAPTQANLGDLAVGTATQDYFYLETGGSVNPTGQLTISNLNPAKAYKFYVFASRPTTSTRISNFVFTGASSFTGQVQTSNGTTGNITTILNTSLLYPNASGEITINLSIVSGSFAYINAMKMEEYLFSTAIDVTALGVNGNDITASGQTSQMSVTVIPANATSPEVSWTIDNSNVATISTNGLVTPVSNGSVIVTATNIKNPAISNSKTINISNQSTALYFSGTATENGDNPATSIPMKMVTGLSGNVTNIFEIYTSLNPSGTFKFYSSKLIDAAVYGDNNGPGTLTLNGGGIDPSETGPVLITVNLTTNTYTILPINWSVVGSNIPNGWNGDEPLTYQGNGLWSATIAMNTVTTDTNPRFNFKGNASWSYVMKRVQNTVNTVRMESQATTYGIPVEDIGTNYNTYNITLDLRNYTYSVACTSIDNHKISVMGSSVANGQGATSNHGYAYQYGQLLGNRFTAGIGSEWTTSNLAVNGNNTVAVLNRWEKDLMGDCSKYVIYGLSLGNEGIHENGQPSFDQFRDNMLLLIAKAVQNGKIPVIMNNYTRDDYNATDYNYIKEMNMLIQQWNVPSINLLGAIDNGAGQWTTGYQSDALHPNDAGHAEFFYAMVPSLFDALEQQKPLPQIVTGTSININNTVPSGTLKFTPENIIHSFTTSFDIKTNSTGNIASFTTSTTAIGTLAIDTNGHLTYTSPTGNTITGTVVVNNNQWHKITLTHFYARGESILYTDNTASGSVNENLEAKVFSLNPANATTSIQYRNWFFYRSGMNTSEINALNNGQMLKSSLELYAPLDGQGVMGGSPYTNLAQSTNTIDSTNFSLGISDYNLKTEWQYANPVKEFLTIYSNNLAIKKLEVYNTLGTQIASVIDSKTIDMSSLPVGLYLVKVYSDRGNKTIKVIKN